MAITFKELSLIAELHYVKLPDAFKDKAAEFFDALDQDGDGAVTLPELLNSNLEGKFGQEFIQHVFYNLDEEGKGRLEFRECLTLYYLCMYSARTCTACGRNIPQGLGYTCAKCRKEGQPPNNEFNLCLGCFSSHSYHHDHSPLHLLHDFVLFDNLLHSRPSSPTASPLAPVRAVEQSVKQCVICGDYHESAIRGFTCDVHMSKLRGSNEWVCEWCFSYLCSKCGNLFRDSTTRAEPGKWLQRFVCPACHQRNITSDNYDASLVRLQRALGGSELVRQCKTCEIKQRNGTLFWIVNGSNKALPSAAPQAQPWAPSPSARSWNASVDHQPQMHHSYSGSGGSDGSFHNIAGYDKSSFHGGRAGDGSSHGSSSHSDGSSHGGSSHGGSFGGPRVNRGPASVNRPNMNEAATAAVRAVNRMVKVAGRAANNMLNAGGGAGGGGNTFNAGGGGVGGGGNMYNAGGGVGGGGGGGGNMFNVGDGAGGGGVGGYSGIGDGTGMANDGGGYIDGGFAGNGGIDPTSFLPNLGSLMGGGGDGGGDGSGGIDAVSMLASVGSLVGGLNSES